MRKDGITLMVAHPFVDYFSAHAHSRDSTGGHLDDYMKMVGIGLSMAPMKALKGVQQSSAAPNYCITSFSWRCCHSKS